MFRENEYRASNGLAMLLLLLVLTVVSVASLINAGTNQRPGMVVLSLLVLVVVFIFYAGLFIVNPGDAKALVLFGSYKGTVKKAGFWFANPFITKRRISLRIRNFETAKLKVNDKRGNPVEIACVVVWRVVDTAEAAFQVDNYENYVHVQSESALRTMTTGYPYDAHHEGEVTLSSHTAEVSTKLRTDIQDRLEKAGVEVIETRVTHLAYAQEIAAAMLRRQQAAAVVAARQTIVEGAVGMVENALELLARKKVIELDEERKASMVSNLLVVLCSEQNTQPVVNTGTLYR